MRPYTERLYWLSLYIIERNSDKKVVGYFSLANDRITIKDFPSNNEFNKFRKTSVCQ